MFSEPAAGSDLAGLATRASRDGDDWIVSGQKVWTSLGHTASFGLLLARTDPAALKHAGLTYFLLDMSLPGVEVRPLRQLTGDAEFNEVFLNDVRVPDSARIGDVGAGWTVVMTTLVSERQFLSGAGAAEPIDQALTLWRSRADIHATMSPMADRLALMWTEATAAALLRQQARGPADGSIHKLRMADLNQAIYEICLDMMGPDGITYDTYAMRRPTHAAVHGDADPRRGFLRTLANSIEGGTSEIQRTVIAERVLGLPPEPRVDKGIAWRDIPTGGVPRA